MGVVVDFVEDVGDFVGDVVEGVGDVVGEVVEFAGDVVEQAIKDPLGTIAAVATIVYAPQLAPYLISAGVPAAIATPVAAATLSGTMTAVQGGDFEDILKSAGAAGFGNYVGGKVGGSVTKDFGKTAGAVAGGTTSGTVGTFIQTGDIDKALKSGIVAGGTAGLITEGRDIFKEFGEGTNSTGTRTSSGLQPGQKIPTSPFGTTETVSPTSPYGTMTYDTMPGMTYAPSFFETDVGEVVSEGGQELAGNAISSQLAEILGLIPSSAAGGSGGLPASTAPYTGQGSGTSAGTAALAQALRVADPGSPLFSPAGGQQEGVWNTESLRYKDQNRS
jgi:hypothetical protein